MDAVLATLLFLHVAGAIIAFGPSFVFPIIGGMGGKEPQHANFAIRLTERLEERIVLPLALVQGVTGILLIWKAPFDLFSTHWLLLGIILYIAALAIAFMNQLPVTRKLVEATSAPPPAARARSVAARRAAAAYCSNDQEDPARRHGLDRPPRGDHLPDGDKTVLLGGFGLSACRQSPEATRHPNRSASKTRSVRPEWSRSCSILAWMSVGRFAS